MSYQKDVYESAEEVLRELNIKTKEDAERQSDSIEDWIHTDSKNAVTYTEDAYSIMLHTRNEDAFLDMDFVNTEQGASTVITQLAYWAYRQDLSELVQDLIRRDS